MKTLVMLLSIALLASCANPSAKNHIKNIESQIVVTGSGEDFSSFYHYFVSDSIFQVERVVFPITVNWSFTLDTGTEMDSSVYFTDNTYWHYIRIRDYQDQDIQGLTFNNDSTEAYLDSDQTFIRDNGKWYLSDYSTYIWRNGR